MTNPRKGFRPEVPQGPLQTLDTLENALAAVERHIEDLNSQLDAAYRRQRGLQEQLAGSQIRKPIHSRSVDVSFGVDPSLSEVLQGLWFERMATQVNWQGPNNVIVGVYRSELRTPIPGRHLDAIDRIVQPISMYRYHRDSTYYTSPREYDMVAADLVRMGAHAIPIGRPANGT
jgi:hypothetical protein